MVEREVKCGLCNNCLWGDICEFFDEFKVNCNDFCENIEEYNEESRYIIKKEEFFVDFFDYIEYNI